MSLMDKVMASVVGKLSLEQKQAMMLKMMPMMMQDVNMAETMLKMMPTMLDHISLLDIIQILRKIFPDLLDGVKTVSGFMAKLKEVMPQMAERIPGLMEKLMPMLEVMLPMMMGRMMPLMLTDENMDKIETFPKRLLPKMLENENIKNKMPEMMVRIMPHCLEEMLPLLPETEKAEFTKKMRALFDAA